MKKSIDLTPPLPLLVSYEYTTKETSTAMAGTVVMRNIEVMTPNKKKEIEEKLRKKIETGFNTQIGVFSVTGWQRFEDDD